MLSTNHFQTHTTRGKENPHAMQMRFDKEKTRNICFVSENVIFFVRV